MRQPRLNLQFSVLQALYWGVHCVFSGFYVALMQSYGYNAMMIGLLTMLSPLAGVVAQPLWGNFIDRTGRIRQAFLAALLASMVAAALLFFGKHSALLLAPAVLLISAAYQSMAPVVDSWSLLLRNAGGRVNYGLTRAFGSLAYAVMAVAYGLLFDRFGMWLVSVILLGGCAVVLGSSLAIRQPAVNPEGRPAASFLPAMKELEKNRAYLTLLISIAVLSVGMSAIDMTFYPVLLHELGGSNLDLGIAWFLMAASEAPVMLLYNRLTFTFSHRRMLQASYFFYAVKCLLIALAPDLTVLILAQLLQMLSFGLMWPSAVHYINSIVEPRLMVTAQMGFSAALGAGFIIGSLVGGVIAQALGVRNMMMVFLPLLVAALALLVLLARNENDGTIPR